MTAPANTVCSAWASAEDVTVCDNARYDDIDPYILDDMLLNVSGMLWRKTGKRYPGACEALVRPALRCDTSRNAPLWHGTGTYGCWGVWDDCAGICDCDRRRISLGRSPIISIDEITIDGEVLDPSEYRVDQFRWLTRLADADGNAQHWPCCDRYDLPLTAEDTFGITFTYGRVPPPELVTACAWMAGEFALAMCGQDCDLPEGITRASREGLDFAVITPTNDMWAQLPLFVRLAIDGANPNGLTRAPKVWSPDGPGVPVRPGTA